MLQQAFDSLMLEPILLATDFSSGFPFAELLQVRVSTSLCALATVFF